MGSAGMGAGQRRGVSVSMDPSELSVDPGGQVTTTVTLRNLGTRVEEFELLVQGPGAVHASVMPATVSVYPDLEQRAVVRFAPPRRPQSVAGVTTFEVVGRSVVHTDVADVARGRLTVTAFQDLQAVLVPESSRGRKPGRHLVKLTNGGNTPLTSDVVFKEQAPLSFEPQRSTATLAPGETAELPVLVKGAHRWFGRPELTAFSGVATPAGAQPPIMLQGTRTQNAMFPWWVPLAAAGALALGIMLAFLWPTPKVPDITQSFSQAVAVQTLKDAGYQPDVVLKGDDNVPAGFAIGTVPEGGKELKSGEHVTLNISSGKCANGCPVDVPDVVGQPLADAQAALEAKHFTVTVDRVSDEQRPADHVISSDPAPNTPRPVPSEVKLKVSTGPKEPNQPLGGQGGVGVVPGGGGGGAGTGGGASPAPSPPPATPAPTPPPATPAPTPAPTPVQQIKLPDVKGQSAKAATTKLTDLGLKVKTETQASNAVPDGQVLSTTPAAATEVAPGSEVTLTVAKNSAPVDLIATADQAKWVNGSGASLTATNENECAVKTASDGFVRTCPPRLDHGESTPYLETNPQKTKSITGTYTLAAPIVAGDHLLARVGLLSGSPPVTFLVQAKSAKGEQLKKSLVVSDSQLHSLDIDLSPAEGASSIELTVTPGSSTTQNSASTPVPVWQGLRIAPKTGK